MLKARDHMHVKLRHEVAQCRDVELVWMECITERACRAVDLVGERMALGRVEVEQLVRAGDNPFDWGRFGAECGWLRRELPPA